MACDSTKKRDATKPAHCHAGYRHSGFDFQAHFDIAYIRSLFDVHTYINSFANIICVLTLNYLLFYDYYVIE